MESILRFQRDFFEKGIAYLKPMVLSDVAQDIGMHRSTISRATTHKYTHTPQGIFELKYFFNSSINRVLKKPYSDNKISELLEEVNIEIARRTVAKYRERLKILPASKRRQFY